MKSFSHVLFVAVMLFLGLSGTATAADDDYAWTPTPPRLSYIDGPVSYWRPGAEDWASARSNLPLAEGDALYTGNNATFELQIGPRSFIRADENSQISLVNQDEHFIQFRVTSGLVSFDIRSIAEGDTIEVDTPHAVFSIDHPGYFRLDVDSQTTHFITYRGGRATVTTADDRSMSIYPSEDIVVTASNPTMVATYAAPAPDAWDRWNDERSDRFAESVSSRYLPQDVYGAEDLDHYGYWRVVADYGPVWIPYGVAADWAPYSTGSWVWDPYYEWTWIDDEPWGWAPFHYGRWVYINNYWAWAPGPVVRHPVYSPALVAFMIRDHDFSANVSIGLPGLCWVALSWGEPVIPWWGPPQRRGHPHWDGWGGPHRDFNMADIRYRNADHPHAVWSVPPDKFGRERFRARVETHFRREDFAPVRGELPIKPNRFSLFGGAPKGVQPPRDIITRPVVSTRPPRERALPWKDEGPRVQAQAGPQPRIVKIPARRDEDAFKLPRPPFGPQVGQERTPPPPPPRFGESVRPAAQPAPPMTPRTPATVREQKTMREQARPVVQPSQPKAAPPSVGPQAVPQRQEAQTRRERTEQGPPQGAARQERVERGLPGQPANQMYRGQDRKERRWEQRENR